MKIRWKLIFVFFFLILAALAGKNYFCSTEITESAEGGFALIFLGLAIVSGAWPTKKAFK